MAVCVCHGFHCAVVIIIFHEKISGNFHMECCFSFVVSSWYKAYLCWNIHHFIFFYFLFLPYILQQWYMMIFQNKKIYIILNWMLFLGVCNMEKFDWASNIIIMILHIFFYFFLLCLVFNNQNFSRKMWKKCLSIKIFDAIEHIWIVKVHDVLWFVD